MLRTIYTNASRFLPTIWAPGTLQPPGDQRLDVQSTNHPIFNLLPELLSQIFTYSVDATNPNETDAPINIGAVCKAWRHISISTPHLWSEVHIQQFCYHTPLPSAQTIKTWISRSGYCGFSFNINWHVVMKCDEKVFKAIVDVLLANCAVWKNVDITALANYSKELLGAIPSGTPNLHKLSIRAIEFSVAKLFDAPLVHLTHLRIESPTTYSPPGTNLVLENLRSLHVKGAKHSDVVEILSRSPRLEEAHATFKFTTEESQQILDRARFSLPHLRRLDLKVDFHTWDQEQLGPLDHIDLPVLETLLLLAFNCESANVSHSLWDLSINMVARYEASLRNLELVVRCCGQPQPGFIHRIGGLRHLGIHISALSDDFVRAVVSRFSSSKTQEQQPSKADDSCLESLRILDFLEFYDEAPVSTIIDLAEKEKSSDGVQSVILVLPPHFDVPLDSVMEIVDDDDWVERRLDLCRPMGW
ncbi:hypothetical protein BD410DRAFT_902843 [Rickenella mellea]|uniref:Uncharacterized protein n=1 Tax=Rickenella mellea TaxID=50990 RepID=A0A4Y7PIX9_9AGAM|nr:hypothetical protein BD410DRAFT_902843 [Rickenella mellea]